MTTEEITEDDIMAFSVRVPKAVVDQVQARKMASGRSRNGEFLFLIKLALEVTDAAPSGQTST